VNFGRLVEALPQAACADDAVDGDGDARPQGVALREPRGQAGKTPL
jgi:hypothetical protein